MSVEEVAEKLGVRLGKGLSSEEVERRLREVGFNEVPEEKTSPFLRFLSYFWGPIPWMIEAAALLSALLRHWVDFAIVVILLLVNGVTGFWQEWKAENIIEFLRQKLALKARVLREGNWVTVPARELVPGDIVRVRLGDIVPADIKIVEAESVMIDESAITGESLPVEKSRGDIAYSGTLVKRGELTGIVVATGLNTYFGRTVQLVEKARTVSEYQKLILRIGDYLILLTLILTSIVVVVGLSRGLNPLELIKFSLVLIVAAIPAALPAVLSITMAIGAYELARRQIIVSRLVAIEELAGVDTLCVDKTGTLTLNRLRAGKPVVIGEGFSERDVVFYAVLASREEDKDPIDLAVIDAAQELGVLDEAEKYVQVYFKPFDPDTKRTEAVVLTPEGARLRVAKGAPQAILSLVGGGPAVTEKVAAKVEELAERGYRSIGVALQREPGEWIYVGIIPLFDPPRKDAPVMIREIKSMGVNVKMITGDHVAIAREIARMLGLKGRIYSIEELRSKHPSDQARLLAEADGFAEVLPEHKYMIVDVLQKEGHLVAMTGDGVNDAPALKKANVGIAVANAVDAARAAADLVLLSEGISVIRDAIQLSRKIFGRMKGYVIYRITETIRILFFVAAAMLIYNFYPITPVMIILLALLNDLPILAIAYDNVKVSRKPMRWELPRILALSTAVGLTGVLSSFLALYIGINYFGMNPSSKLHLLQTFIFLKLAVAGHLTIFVTRTEGPFWSIRPGNLLLATAVITKIIATIVAVGGFGLVAPIDVGKALFIWLYALAWFIVNDRVKLIVERIMEGHVVFSRSF
ncbi:MAG: plasma-membrane proton-efflux P-type ATPase [Hyperthermus sp.]|nr:MAG: plasma-membrane proton-efflux P-type ATPase [Hyperthermus sp.]